MSRFVPRLPVRVRFLAVPVLLLLSLAGCAGLAPTDQQRHATDQRNTYAQLVRMGDKFRRDGDRTAACAFCERAYALDPSKPEPLIGIADAPLQTGAMGDAAARAPSLNAPANPLRLAPTTLSGDRQLSAR